MKFTHAVIAALLGLASAAPAEQKVREIDVDHQYIGMPHAPAMPIGKRQSTFAKRVGNKFDYDGSGGRYAAGTNAWWLSHVQDNSVVDKVFQNIAAAGLKVVRVWGFGVTNNAQGNNNVFFQIVNSTGSYINYNSNGVPRLDYVVSAAEKYGVKLVLPLVNNWDDLGGMPTYIRAFGGSKNDWYTQSNSQQAYRQWIAFIVDRYKNSAAIFSWQLANEPRCSGCNTNIITNWARDSSAYIKSLDSQHLVSLGDEGWLRGGGNGGYPYQASEGVDWEANLGISTLDYGTVHIYPSAWGQSLSWASQWISEHASRGAASGKPVVIEEYGAEGQPASTVGPWQSTIESESNIALDQFWQWGDESVRSYGDVYSIYASSSSFNQLVTQHAAKQWAKR